MICNFKGFIFLDIYLNLKILEGKKYLNQS